MILEQHKKALDMSINLNKVELSMFKFDTKPDPLDPIPLIPDPDNVGEEIPDPDYVQNMVINPLAPRVLRWKIKARIIHNEALQRNSEIETGSGVYRGYYILPNGNNEIFEGDTFTHNGQSYEIDFVEQIIVCLHVIGYRANLIKVSE